MDQLENKSLEKANKKIYDNRAKLQADLGMKPLFGAVGGSMSLNLANKSSDIDVYLVVENMPNMISGVIVKKIIISNEKIDFICISINELINECEKYALEDHIFPTVFAEKESEIDQLKRLNDIKCDSFKREMVMRIYMAERILEFEAHAAENSYQKLKKGLKLIDIWDASFKRAYGYYHESIQGMEEVSLRKYLYTVSEIMICRFISECKKPYINFQAALYCMSECVDDKQYMDGRIADICRKLWENNRAGSKAKGSDKIAAVRILNQWIEEQLVLLVDEMKEKEDILKTSFLASK